MTTLLKQRRKSLRLFYRHPVLFYSGIRVDTVTLRASIRRQITRNARPVRADREDRPLTSSCAPVRIHVRMDISPRRRNERRTTERQSAASSSSQQLAATGT